MSYMGLRHFESLDRLCTLALQSRADLVLTFLEPLGACIPDLRQPFRQDGLRFARECLHGPVELSRQSCRRSFARGLHGLRKLLCRRVGVAGRRSRENSLELI